MELYVLDDQLRRVRIIDTFMSLIWTERFTDIGQFELVIEASQAMRTLLPPDTMLATNLSQRVMVVKYLEDKLDEEGRPVLTITGSSLEEILRDRLAKETMGTLTADPDWVITGTPSYIMMKVFTDICITGTLDVADKIPYITTGDFSTTPGSWNAMDPLLMWDVATGYWDSNPYASYEDAGSPDTMEPITMIITPTTVYDVIKNISDAYNIGFRLLRNGDMSQLYFEVYNGVDRTSSQGNLAAVLFSVELDNLSGTTEVRSSSGAKNTAYVFGKNATRIVFSLELTGVSSGFNRKILYVDASDITDAPGSVLNAKLDQRGLEELSKYRNFTAFDGEISQAGVYKYGIDFNLGDIVALQNSDGVINKMRVTEQILVHDDQGERSYPTLVSEIVIAPGSWMAVAPLLYWDNATGYWDNQ